MWRQGTKVPVNIYDEEIPICQTHTVEDANLIVRAVNFYQWLEENQPLTLATYETLKIQLEHEAKENEQA